MKKGKLIITRHHESKWNKESRWTGQHDVDLTPHGLEMSKKMGEMIKEMEIQRAVSSKLKRSIRTLEEMLKTADLQNLKIERFSEINERDYGDYTGKNKWEMKEVFGEERFNCIRREWDCPVPNGETLKTVYERVVPFYLENILPEVLKGKITIVVAHTNSIRALLKYIENIPDDEIKKLEIPFGSLSIYEVDASGHLISKEIKKLN